MDIAENLRISNKTLFTFEILPPLKGRGIDAIYNAIDPLLDFGPSHINITYHAADVEYRTLSNGNLEKRFVKKRPGTVAIAAAVKYKYNIDVVPHIVCGGLDMYEIENILVDLNFLDIHNIFVLRGDPPKGSRVFVPKEKGYSHTTELMEQVNNMNNGIYINSTLKSPVKTDFSMGVACYPEKHIEALNMKTDMHYLKEKVKLGAGYMVTQMFFDNSKYFGFVESCRKEGIDIPIVPGIKPVMSLRDVGMLPQTFNIDLPEELSNELEKCDTDESVYRVGIEWAVKQSKELKDFGVPSIHYYTLGKSDNIREICKEVF